MRRRLTGLLLVLTLVAVLGFGSLAQAQAGTFVGAWPYQVPPVGHYNTFVTHNINLGIYWDLMEMALGMYVWHDGSWIHHLGTSWQIVEPDRFVVQLRRGVKWSDGSDFTAKDVLTTFRILYMMNHVVWRFLDRVEAQGDHTVVFHMARPSTVVPRHVLRTPIRAHSVYGEWGDRVADLISQGLRSDSEAMSGLRAQFTDFRPARMVVSGPYEIDPASITESQLTLRKVPTAWNANQVQFDRVVLYNGETPAVTPVVLAKQVDYATHGFPPATERRFVQEGIRIIRAPIYTGPALYFNHNIEVFQNAQVRRAIAHAINREENAVISLGQSAKPQVYMLGLSDNIAPLWVSAQALEQADRYAYDPAKAYRIFRDLGFTKGGDGVWVAPNGKRMEFELSFPAEFADWAAAAENAAEQLTNFGIRTTLRGVTFTQHPIDVNSGRFELAIRAWGAGNPHPHFSYNQNFFVHNYPSAAEGDGMNFRLQVTSQRYGAVDLEDLVVSSSEGLDEAAQKEAITRMALVFNELLPVIPLWERYGNNPSLEGVRVTGWPQDGDPILTNPPYGDAFTVILILEGRLRPVR